MTRALTVEVRADDAGERIDKLLTRRLRELGVETTRSEVQRWIAEERVTIGGVPVAKKAALEVGTVIAVEPMAPPASAATPDPSVVFAVVFEDEHLLVIDKPAGLVVHPARGHQGGTLVNGLLARPDFSRATADPRDPEGHLRPGIVHRLDKGTSGLLVVAKTAPCRERLKALFARHDIERSYLAVAVGVVRAMQLDTPHGRDPHNRLRFTSRLEPSRPGVRRARTDVAPIARLGPCTLVRCTLHTGRTHQIRVHMLERAQAPLLGDPLYKTRTSDPALAAVASALGRQALHAEVLGFVHPMTGAAMRWQSPLPSDMQRACDALVAMPG